LTTLKDAHPVRTDWVATKARQGTRIVIAQEALAVGETQRLGEAEGNLWQAL